MIASTQEQRGEQDARLALIHEELKQMRSALTSQAAQTIMLTDLLQKHGIAIDELRNAQSKHSCTPSPPTVQLDLSREPSAPALAPAPAPAPGKDSNAAHPLPSRLPVPSSAYRYRYSGANGSGWERYYGVRPTSVGTATHPASLPTTPAAAPPAFASPPESLAPRHAVQLAPSASTPAASQLSHATAFRAAPHRCRNNWPITSVPRLSPPPSPSKVSTSSPPMTSTTPPARSNGTATPLRQDRASSLARPGGSPPRRGGINEAITERAIQPSQSRAPSTLLTALSWEPPFRLNSAANVSPERNPNSATMTLTAALAGRMDDPGESGGRSSAPHDFSPAPKARKPPVQNGWPEASGPTGGRSPNGSTGNISSPLQAPMSAQASSAMIAHTAPADHRRQKTEPDSCVYCVDEEHALLPPAAASGELRSLAPTPAGAEGGGETGGKANRHARRIAQLEAELGRRRASSGA